MRVRTDKNHIARQRRFERAGRHAVRETLDRADQPMPFAGDAIRLRRLGGPRPRSRDPLDRRGLVAWLKRAIRGERGRGVRGDCAYDVNRHIALLQALHGLEAESDARPVRAAKQKRRGE